MKELVSDITYDRSQMTATFREDIGLWQQCFTDIDNENATRTAAGKKAKSLSEFAHPAFLSFIRTPHCASFSIRALNGAEPIEFLGVNAYTLYGNSEEERNREFYALLDWIVQRTKTPERMYYKNMVLMGDLNMDFDDPQTKLSDIVLRLLQLNSTLLTGSIAARANFPFLDVHPGQTSLIGTNAGKDQTFDHIAFFIDKNEIGLPTSDDNRNAGLNGLNGHDYGVFDFVELFSQVLHGTGFFSCRNPSVTIC